MEEQKKPEVRRHGRAYEFNERATGPSPEWLAKHGKVVHMEDLEAAQVRRWCLVAAGIALAAFGLGIVVGRFLLP
jgi:hypothetical protein